MKVFAVLVKVEGFDDEVLSIFKTKEAAEAEIKLGLEQDYNYEHTYEIFERELGATGNMDCTGGCMCC